jgi:hypothetical protein
MLMLSSDQYLKVLRLQECPEILSALVLLEVLEILWGPIKWY